MGLVKDRKTISDLLTREDIPTHFRTTLEKLQLSCLSEKLICILSTLLSTLFSTVFHSNTVLLAIYDQELGNYEFLNKFSV